MNTKCALDARNCANELSGVVFARTCPIHLIRPKTHVLLRFVRFNQSENIKDKHGPGCAPDARNCVNQVSGDFNATNVPNPPY